MNYTNDELSDSINLHLTNFEKRWLLKCRARSRKRLTKATAKAKKLKAKEITVDLETLKFDYNPQRRSQNFNFFRRSD